MPSNKQADIIGKRFGKLVIIERTKNRKIVKVRCDCGTEKFVTVTNLGRSTKSCGCWKATGLWVNPGNIKPFGEAARGALFKSYQREAKERGYSWNIDYDYFGVITKENCFYCNAEPKQKQRGDNGDYIYNGIDRVDNSDGYEMNNIVPCCRKCNRAKDIMSFDEFKNWICAVCENLKSKEVLKAV